MSITRTRRLLALECFLLFVALPASVALLKPRGWVYSILWLILIYCAHMLRKHYDWTLKTDWHINALTWPVARRLLLRFIPFGLALILFMWVNIPDELFSLPQRSLVMWATIMVLYPLLSVLPQEIIVRSFFFRRYKSLFWDAAAMRIASALAFGWMHIIMCNWVAVVFSMIGGLLFSDTYDKTKSLAVVCFEHAVYGCFLFTIGMGHYFFHGHAMH